MRGTRSPSIFLILALCVMVVIYLRFDLLGKECSRPGGENIFNWHKLPAKQFNRDELQLKVSTDKCKVELLVDPFHSDMVRKVVRDAPTLRCDNVFLPEITTVEDLQLKVDIKKLGSMNPTAKFSHCRYRKISGVHEDDMKIVYSEWSEPFTTSVSMEENAEFVHVNCFGEPTEDTTISKSFFSLVPKRRHLEKLYEVKLNKRRVKYHPRETLSIVIVGIDGTSRHQFMRTMPKTYKYLTEDLGSFDFTTQGQHGDNTFSNFLPLLSGNLESEVKEWWNLSYPQDAFDFMFDDFEKAGFRTLYSEDNPLYSGFYWGDRFFTNPLATYWNRPVHLAMVAEKGFVSRNGSCLGPRTISEFQLDYILEFLNTFHNKPVFATSFFDAITHYETAQAGVIDEHLHSFYQRLVRQGHLKNSLVILLSDHGPRWGNVRQSPNGRVESRIPFLFLTLPPWFLQKYPTIADNLKANTQVMTSYLDLHQTLLDLLYFQSTSPSPLQRTNKGISLFEPIPHRACEGAYIPEHQCFCKKWIETPLDVSSRIAQEVSHTLLQEIRSRSDKTECEEFSLGQIISVNILTAKNINYYHTKEHQTDKLYRVRLSTLPGNAVFEGKVHYDNISKYAEVEEEVERLNLFRGEKECLPTRRQVFCYCKSNLLRYKSDLNYFNSNV